MVLQHRNDGATDIIYLTKSDTFRSLEITSEYSNKKCKLLTGVIYFSSSCPVTPVRYHFLMTVMLISVAVWSSGNVLVLINEVNLC